jgi:hypothetical protein
MPPTLEVIGVYPIGTREPCHLVEVVIRNCPGVFDLGQITQRRPGKRKSNWQVPWMEHILDAEGECLLSPPFQSAERPELWHGNVRLVFYFHYLNFAKPLLTPFGECLLPQPTCLPLRLWKICRYQEPN